MSDRKKHIDKIITTCQRILRKLDALKAVARYPCITTSSARCSYLHFDPATNPQE